MPKTRTEKEVVVQKLAQGLGRMRAAVFANYEGLKVKEIEELRRTLKKEGIDYTVAKKTLLALAMKQAGKAIDPKSVPGNFATVISYEDEVAPARILAKFAKDHEALKLVAGILEDHLIDGKTVLALAKLPSKQELLSKLVRSLNAPASGFVNVLAGNLRNFIYALNAIRDKKPA
ncbi:50S ribosomal protein L10 [Candidatus Uhrbacteria bacterium]|nr:50S ribosomal protein L10 [Candidatus Uhrbacteria bacterium]